MRMHMKHGSLVLKILFVTLGAFALSYVSAAVGNVGDDYPSSLAIKYSDELTNQVDLNFKKVFEAQDIEELHLETVSADVEFEVGELAQVNVEIQGRFSVPDKDPEQIIKYKVEGKTLYIKTREGETNENSYFRFNVNPDTGHARIRLPASIKRLVIKTVSGNIGLQKFDLETLQVKTVSGDVTSDTLKSKNADFKTVSGDFHLGGAFENLGFQSVSGDLNLGLLETNSKMNISSTSGDVELTLPKDPDLRLNFSTVSGELEYDPTFGYAESEELRQHRTFGSGLGEINLRTISGDVSIAKVPGL